jgi:hypothetical protein
MINLSEAKNALEGTLENIFPTKQIGQEINIIPEFSHRAKLILDDNAATNILGKNPIALIPVFP